MKNTGIWIDSRQAKILDWDGSQIRWRTVYSGAEKKPKIDGEKSKRTQRGITGFDYASTQEARFREDLKKYFRVIRNEVASSDNLYLLGPAEAKVLLEKEIKKSGTLKSRVLKVEPCDSLTDNQLAEKVLTFFKSRNKSRKP
jgi:hypothetical protein